MTQGAQNYCGRHSVVWMPHRAANSHKPTTGPAGRTCAAAADRLTCAVPAACCACPAPPPGTMGSPGLRHGSEREGEVTSMMQMSCRPERRRRTTAAGPHLPPPRLAMVLKPMQGRR